MNLIEMPEEFKQVLLHITRNENLNAVPNKSVAEAQTGELKETLFYNEPALAEFVRDADELLGYNAIQGVIEHPTDTEYRDKVEALYKKHITLFKTLGFPRCPWDLGYLDGDEWHRSYFFGPSCLLRGDWSVDKELYRKSMYAFQNMMKDPDKSYAKGFIDIELEKEFYYKPEWRECYAFNGRYYHISETLSYELLPIYNAKALKYLIIEHRPNLSHVVGTTSDSEAIKRIELLTKRTFDKRIYKTFHTMCKRPHKIIKSLKHPTGFLPPEEHDKTQTPRFNELEPRYFANIAKNGYDALPASHRFRQYSKSGMPTEEFFFINKFMHHLFNSKDEPADVQNYVKTLLAVKLRHEGLYPAIIVVLGFAGTGKNFFADNILQPLFETTNYVESEEHKNVFAGQTYKSKYESAMTDGLYFSLGVDDVTKEKPYWTDNHVLVIDEASADIRETKSLYNKLKRLSGSGQITLRKMYSEGYLINNNMSVFMFLNNSASYSFEIDDRRAIICKPSKLRPKSWLEEAGFSTYEEEKLNINLLKELIFEELLAFALHLYDINQTIETPAILHDVKQTQLLRKLNQDKQRAHTLAYGLTRAEDFKQVLEKILVLDKDMYDEVVYSCTQSKDPGDKDHITLGLLAKIYNVLGDKTDFGGNMSKARDNIKSALFSEHHIEPSDRKVNEDVSYYVDGLSLVVYNFDQGYKQREEGRKASSSEVINFFNTGE